MAARATIPSRPSQIIVRRHIEVPAIARSQGAIFAGVQTFYEKRRRKTAVTTLYCAVGLPALEAIRLRGWKSFPPCAQEEAAFYPVLHEHFALEKARQWPAPDGSASYVMCFRITALYARSFEVQTLSGEVHEELWVPAEELENFNRNIVGKIRMLQALLPE